MATTTTKRKTTAKTAKAETAKVETPVEIIEETPKTTRQTTKKTFKDSDGILCRSVIQGSLFMEGLKTKILYTWVDYGDKTFVEYDDLAAAVKVRSWFVFSPTFIVEDEDFIKEFPQLEKYYTENYSVMDLEEILNLPVDEMVAEVKALPKSALESLKVIAASSITDGSFDSVKKIKALDEILETSLSVLAEFND